MYNTSFIKRILLALTVVLLYSCDKDFNAIGDDLIGDDHFGLESEKYDVIAFNQEVTPIQSNVLAVNALGIYDNPVFGTTTANFATQVDLSTTYPVTIGEEPVITSVRLSIPYFKKLKTTNSDGTHTYTLDSIYGPAEGKLKLSVYESGVQMRSSYVSNGVSLPQFYYTDENNVFNQYKVGARLNNSSNVLQNDQFFFSSAEYVDKTTDAAGKETTTYTPPEMRLDLDTAYFQQKILNAPASKLSAPDLFQEYFRGLYFSVEKADGSPGNMALLDFSGGKIVITYKAKTASTTDADTEKEDKTITMTIVNPANSSANANLLQDVKSANYQNAITTANINKTEGDERLYVKGGQGSLAIIRLNDFAAKLEEIRAKNWKVNEANLVFNIDADKMTGAREPKRVYLYDLTNNVPVVDYLADGSGNLVLSDSKTAKYIYGGMINLDDNKRGKNYKIRITEHIRNLIKDKTAKNVDLGLVVTESIAISTSNFLKNKNENISQAPRASVMNPLGTILYGGKSSVPEDKRLRLEVYYTKPN